MQRCWTKLALVSDIARNDVFRSSAALPVSLRSRSNSYPISEERDHEERERATAAAARGLVLHFTAPGSLRWVRFGPDRDHSGPASGMDRRGICPAAQAPHVSGDANVSNSVAVREGSVATAAEGHSSGRHPAEVLLFRTLLSALQLFPPIASRVAYWRFFRPRRSRPRKVKDLRTYDLAGQNDSIRVYEGGEGPAILVVHGWESSVARLEVLLHALIANGFRIVAFDMPAHGHSRAENTDILQITKVIVALAESAGPFAAAIGHSFGGVCLTNAIRAKLEVARLVLFSTPSTLSGMIDKYCRVLGIGRPTKVRLVRAIEERLASSDLEREFDLRLILQASDVRTLIIHDREDPLVPFSEGEELSRARADIQLFATDDLGHSRIIRDREAIDKCISFISDDQPE